MIIRLRRGDRATPGPALDDAGPGNFRLDVQTVAHEPVVWAPAARDNFWGLTREMLRMRHDDPADLHRAMLRAGLDPEPLLDAMHAGNGADRIVDDAASARASGVAFSPALFVNGARYGGTLDPTAVAAALAPPAARVSRGRGGHGH